jgi:hypothetical protein
MADIHDAIYKRIKADETATNLIAKYERDNPAHNNLAQPIHEHGDAIVRPKPAWLIAREKAIARRQKPQNQAPKKIAIW